MLHIQAQKTKKRLFFTFMLEKKYIWCIFQCYNDFAKLNT